MSNPDAGERAYAYAKACGIISKSFVGKRISILAGLHSLSELDRLVFPELHRELPGRELLIDLETRIVSRAVRHILAVISSYEEPPELLVHQLRSFEYADLKTCLHYIVAGKRTAPVCANLGRFSTIKFKFFPDLERMLTGTEFEFVLKENISADSKFDLTAVETELDMHYYRKLAVSLGQLSSEDSSSVMRILCEEISLRNCVWALRLRSYFNESAAEAAEHLMDIQIANSDGRGISLSRDAYKSLDKPLDTRSAWNDWKWEKFLNPEKYGEMWKVDPRHFQNAASEYLYRLALSCFHHVPFAVGAISCYIKLKQFEEDILTSITEGIDLGMSCADVFTLLEVPV
ncbi:MAG: V-type ATPase subunit [Treponema sp.]|jgi:vacuolar-type H+-ATPase subunit C/Vma6|nr:V-type ATPase subunit [Treponema sp.]